MSSSVCRPPPVTNTVSTFTPPARTNKTKHLVASLEFPSGHGEVELFPSYVSLNPCRRCRSSLKLVKDRGRGFRCKEIRRALGARYALDTDAAFEHCSGVVGSLSPAREVLNKDTVHAEGPGPSFLETAGSLVLRATLSYSKNSEQLRANSSATLGSLSERETVFRSFRCSSELKK